MEADRYRRMDAIFEAALDLEESERSAFLDTACGTDVELRQSIERLIELDEEASDFLSEPLQPPPDVRSEPDLEDFVGLRLGPYLLIRRLGHGGMGSIYLAERQDEYHQQVAVKIMHRGFANDEMKLRFRTERQALARLEHPNIARLYDGGTSEDGLPYLVMELIDGSPIDRYCDRHRLSLSRRLRLFQKLCGGVDHAHRNLLVHRDIKPTNVLVTRGGVPKLLDFGIAKQLGPVGFGAAGEETDMRPMTPGYASPEQVLGHPITTASDVYSLGVLLYELLSGRRPYRMTGELPFLEVQRSVCQDDPSPPSRRVLEDVDGRGRSIQPEELASQRGTTAADLRRQLEGDLDHIVLKAMSKNPSQRYASVEELVRDIDNYFDGHPVEARPHHWSYTGAKFLGRHVLAVIAAGVVLLLLGGSFLAVSHQAHLAAVERDKARSVTQFLLEIFEVSSPNSEVADSYTARQLIDLASERVLQTPEAQDTAHRANLLQAMGQIQNSLGRIDEAEELLQAALELHGQTTSKSVQSRVRALTELANIALQRDQLDRADTLYREALELLGSTGSARELRHAHADIWQGQAMVLERRGDSTAALALVRQSLDLYAQLDGDSPSRSRARCRFRLARLLHRQGLMGEAEASYLASLEEQRRVLGERHPETTAILLALAELGQQQGDDDAYQRWHAEWLQARQLLWGSQVLAAYENAPIDPNQSTGSTDPSQVGSGVDGPSTAPSESVAAAPTASSGARAPATSSPPGPQ